jgi:tol-pal system protein YbgF
MRTLLVIAILGAFCAPAYAQDMSGLQQKIDRLERDMTFLQRQIYRGGATADPNAPAVAGVAGAQAQVQLTQIQEEMRQLRGSFETLQYEIARLKSEQKAMSEDIDFRLQALEQKVAALPEEPAEDAALRPSDAEALAEIEEDMPASYQPDDQKKTEVPIDESPSDDAYNQAFALLNAKQYAKSADAFSGFVKKYPRDPLVPNAYYWLGESFYARGDYVRAADGFRKGYEADPKGQKSADNLLKLGLSLANVKRTEEACLVLEQVAKGDKKHTPESTRARAVQATSRLKCK